MINLKSKDLIDPRGQVKRGKIELAKRLRLEELKKEKILFYNNTKLDFAEYYEIFTTLKEEFKKMGLSNIVEIKETVRGKGTDDFYKQAKGFAEQDFKAAVVVLGDMGTSSATTILTIQLEKVGIPSVYITAPPGAGLVESVASLRAGHLCLCPIDIYQASTKEEIRKEILNKMNFIIDSITLPPDQIEKCAEIPTKLDQTPSDGVLKLEVMREVKDNVIEPGLFMEETMDLFDSLHITDGLPIIPPTEERLSNMMSYCPFKKGEVLAQKIGPSGKDITVKDIAVAAVMAGCKPEYMPILITAFRCMANQKYNFTQSVTTSHPGGNLVLVSGPIAQELHIHGGQGCLGPGFRANATIGRAVNLVLINVCRSVPGIADLACLSSQAEYTYCFGEDPTLTSWTTINQDHYDAETTVVYVLKAEGQHTIIEFLTNTAEDLIKSIIDCATTLGSNNCYCTGPLVVCLTPDHAKIFEKDGWNKEVIKNYIHQTVHWPKEQVINRGLVPVRPAGFEYLEEIPVTRNAEDIQVVVAGGRGGHSAVLIPWALHSEGIIEPVTLPNGNIAKSIKEFIV
ncbi:MAG: hypothetical protein PHI72_05480 [Atribacterota bacterium]|nr:hypothetical protein [Atribacterota bacterium]MDD5637124.1 hypothetical protein [Atribacterota bacterium]